MPTLTLLLLRLPLLLLHTDGQIRSWYGLLSPREAGEEAGEEDGSRTLKAALELQLKIESQLVLPSGGQQPYLAAAADGLNFRAR